MVISWKKCPISNPFFSILRSGGVGEPGVLDMERCLCQGHLWQGCCPAFGCLSSNGPVVLFNRAFNTLVVSPLDNFKSAVHTFSADANAWETGVSSEIQSLPKGFYHRTLIMAGVGITQAMDEYGQTIRKVYSTKRPLQRKDPVVNYLSYWTEARLLLSYCSYWQNSTISIPLYCLNMNVYK